MQSLAYSGIAIAALMVSAPVLAHSDSHIGAPPVNDMAHMGMPQDRGPAPAAPNAMMVHGDDQRPSYGYQLPREWMAPQYFIADYRAYRLGRPARGFGWSHYRDEIVLTDQWGRVYDVRDGRDSYSGNRRKSGFGSRESDGIAGGVAGAAAGAVAGNLIAGAGSRLAGSLIGGGVGALAGLAVEAAISKHHRRDRHRDGDRAYDDGSGYDHGAHWGGYPAQNWSYGGCNCGSGETITTTTVTHSGGGYMVPRRTVWYENVYEAGTAKYRVRAAAPTKYRERAAPALAPAGKTRARTKLHTKTYKGS